METHRILPIRTSDRILFELVPEEDGHAWKPTRKVGEHITATVRPLSRIEVQEITAIEDPKERITRIVSQGFISATFDGSPVTVDELPYLHWQSLGGAIFAMSVTGADPFGPRPVASQL